MARKGFKRNPKTISNILKTDPGGQAAVRAAAAKIADAAGTEASTEEYVTDRFVVGVKVPADSQARDGVATRAASQVANG